MNEKQTKMKNPQIAKLRNPEGYYFTCLCCGASIKHAYSTSNAKGLYGSECVYKVAGLSYEGSQKQIRELKWRDKEIGNILKAKKSYNWEAYKDAHGYSDEELINHFLTKGKLG